MERPSPIFRIIERMDLVTKDTGELSGHTAVKQRVQAMNPVTNRYVKIDTQTGRILEQKKTAGPYKGIREITGAQSNRAK